jgi:hypothetical protein
MTYAKLGLGIAMSSTGHRNSSQRNKRYVVGPDGTPLPEADLPPPDTNRWVARRKAVVVAAVQGGLLTVDEACARYRLSIEEFMSWVDASRKHGLDGLKATRLKSYRYEEESEDGL